MAITLYEMRQKAPTAALATAFETIIRTEPLLSQILWDSCSGDEYPYRRSRGAATAAYFNPDSTLSDGTDESFDRLVAHIRPIAGQIQTPIIGSSSGSILDHVKAKTRAVVYTFMNAAINGGFGTVTLSPTMTANDGAVAGPYWDTTARGDGFTLRLVVAGGGATTVMDLKRDGDTGYGLVDGAAAADLQASGDAVYRFASANPNYFITIDLDVSDLLVQWGSDGTYYVKGTITSSTNASDGLLKLVLGTSSMLDTPSAAAEAFDLAHLDLLRQECNTGGRKVFLMAERTERSFLAEMRGLGGVTWMEVAGKQVAAYNGTPVLTSSYVPVNRTYAMTANCAPIFMIDVDEGLRGIYRGGNGSASYDGKSFGGLRVSNLGEIVTNAENELYRITAHWGLAHLHLPGIVCMDGITN